MNVSAKDAKALINENKKLKKLLTENALLADSYLKRAHQSASVCLQSGTLNNLAEYSIVYGKDIYPDSVAVLLKDLYYYITFRPHSQLSESTKAALISKTDSAVKQLSVYTGIFPRLFSSKEKKENAENAYAFLTSDEYSSLKDRILQIAENGNALKISLPADIFQDFNSRKEEYRNVLSQVLPEKDKTILQCAFSLENRLSSANSKVNEARISADRLKGEIEQCAQRVITEDVMKTLENVSVDDAFSGHGLRLKPLKEAGFTTVAKVFAAPVSRLERINGISEDSAYVLKYLAKENCIAIQKTAKLKLSTDKKTPAACALTEAVYRFKREQSLVSHTEELRSALAVSQQIDFLKTLSGRDWLFFSDSEKEDVRNAYSSADASIKEYSDAVSDAVNKIKYSYNAKNESWDDFSSDPISYFNIIENIVPELLGNDDTVYGLPEELARSIQDEAFFPDGLNCTLRRYQEWGVKYILNRGRVLLGDEMGLGKTVQAIAAMVSLKNTGETHFAVICPASVLPNWCKEIEEKSKFTVFKIHGSTRQKVLKDWIACGGVAVTTYETTARLELKENFSFGMLTVDEAHYIKNENAIRSKSVRRWCKHSNRLLFMTGTPLENNTEEMISLIGILNKQIADELKPIAYLSSAPQFRQKIAPVYYRRKREDVLTELPELTEVKEWCTLTSKSEISLYRDSLLNGHYQDVRRLSWQVNNLADSCKANKLLEIINEASSDGRKILVFSFFLDTVRKVCTLLGDRCLAPINGSLSPQRRQEIIDEFNLAPSGTVLCAQIQSGGTGLNIQSASVVIICEPQLKPSIENQAISRAYRMGQARNVLVYRLLCEDTVDERICEMLDEKQRLFDAFADKSVAASETTEIDDKTFGKIIEEEIEKIKKEKAGSSKGNIPKENSAECVNSAAKDTDKTAVSDTAKNGEYIFTSTEDALKQAKP